MIDRHWFFTWRTYGTWLPGEEGFVGNYLTHDRRRVTDNAPGMATTTAMPGLTRHAQSLLTHPPVLLSPAQAETVEVEILRTCRFRTWEPDALAVMPNHVHLLFGVPNDPDPDDMLTELKAYCSRVLNKPVHRPKGWWWADDGSTRRVKGDDGRTSIAKYIRDQPGAVCIWLSEVAQRLLAERAENEVKGLSG